MAWTTLQEVALVYWEPDTTEDLVGQVEVETITVICRPQFVLTLKPIATQLATASHAAWQFARLAVCVALEVNWQRWKRLLVPEVGPQ